MSFMKHLLKENFEENIKMKKLGKILGDLHSFQRNELHEKYHHYNDYDTEKSSYLDFFQHNLSKNSGSPKYTDSYIRRFEKLGSNHANEVSMFGKNKDGSFNEDFVKEYTNSNKYIHVETEF